MHLQGAEFEEGYNLQMGGIGMDYPSYNNNYYPGMTGDNTKPKSVVNSTGKTFQDIINKLPESDLKNGLKEYLDVLGYEEYNDDNDVQGGNSGIAKYLSSRFSSPMNSCVRDAALSFYEDVAKVLKKNSRNQCDISINKKNLSSASNYGCDWDLKRAGLLDVAGAGQYKKLKPGWVWKLALKHANGDPNSAMFLVGICGHDDSFQGRFSYLDSSSKALEELQARKMKVIENKKKVDLEIKELTANYDTNQEKIYSLLQDANNLSAQIRSFANQSTVSRAMSCPPKQSGFYAPQGLDSKADIPREVKNEILNVQGKIDGAKNIPAKYYHVYGSAFMACQLIQNGVSPTTTSLVQQQAARFYRGIRMCEIVDVRLEKIEAQAKVQEPLLKKYNAKDEVNLVLSTIKAIKQKKINCDYSNNEYPSECEFLERVGYSPYQFKLDQFEATESEIREKIEGYGRDKDAALLYHKWYFGGNTVMGKKIPCSDIRVAGPSDLLKPTEGFFKQQNTSYKPEGWTDSRYKLATQKLATWDVDFKWTIAQHTAGAEFAGKVCKKRDKDEKPLKGICPDGPPDVKMSKGPWGMGQPSTLNQETKGTR